MGVETKNDFPFSVDTWSKTSERKPFRFLTHAHKDHTAGIQCYGKFPIYCSSLTAKLVCRREPKLNPSMFRSLEIGESRILEDTGQRFTVTAYDAHHCPGAIMLLFEGPFGNVLHTGDCRFTSECLHQLMHYIRGSARVLDCVYLDCTFGACPMIMPSTEDAIEQVKRCIWNHPSEAKVYLACNMLGQETLLETIAKDFSVKIFVDKDRLPNYFADLEVIAPDFLTTDKESTRFEICEAHPNLHERALEAMNEAKEEGRVQPLFIRPSTLWYVFQAKFQASFQGSFQASFQADGSEVINSSIASSKFGRSKLLSPRASLTNATKDAGGVYHVCYCMHSSQIELKAALKLLDPLEVISTTPNCEIFDYSMPSLLRRNSITTVEIVEHCGVEDRELQKGRKNYYFCSTSSKVTISDDVASPGKLIPLFGHAQYFLPPSPPASPTRVSTSSPTPPPPPPPSVALSSPSPSDTVAFTLQVSSRGLTSSQNARAKRLFVEPELEVETSSSNPLPSPMKKIQCVFDPLVSLVNEPDIPAPVALPSACHRSVSKPLLVAPHEDTHVRSWSFPRLLTRRRVRIPDPLPSLLDMKRSCEGDSSFKEEGLLKKMR